MQYVYDRKIVFKNGQNFFLKIEGLDELVIYSQGYI